MPTKVKTDEHGLIQLTCAVNPLEKINTQYGRVTCERWLELEEDRITRKGGVCIVKKDIITKRVALWVEPVNTPPDPMRKFSSFAVS